uniref:Uncharacterized protein n=1 Tax=Pipistrellus kuhlii TaxID=59472 RepID=A0A7J7WDL2_PIPKU|nr:hypothetical protein mPipKuh1_008092 [Pipistrellus kuhlii]
MRGAWRAWAEGGRSRIMAGVGRSRMEKQVSEGTRPKQGASHCHQNEPLVVTEISLLSCITVLPGAHTHCQLQPREHPLLAPSAGTNSSAPSAAVRGGCRPQSLQGFSTSPWSGRAVGASSSLLHPLPATAPLAPTAGTQHWPRLLHTISEYKRGWCCQRMGVGGGRNGAACRHWTHAAAGGVGWGHGGWAETCPCGHRSLKAHCSFQGARIHALGPSFKNKE